MCCFAAGSLTPKPSNPLGASCFRIMNICTPASISGRGGRQHLPRRTRRGIPAVTRANAFTRTINSNSGTIVRERLNCIFADDFFKLRSFTVRLQREGRLDTKRKNTLEPNTKSQMISFLRLRLSGTGFWYEILTAHYISPALNWNIGNEFSTSERFC